MSRPFANAWLLLKNANYGMESPRGTGRSHEIMRDPDEEQGKRDDMQRLIDQRVDNSDDQQGTMDDFNNMYSDMPLERPEDAERHLADMMAGYDERHELMRDMQEQGDYDESLGHDIHETGQDMGPMADQRMMDASNMREAEGMDMPMRPRGPPVNIGQAGSTGAMPREGNPFQQAMSTLDQRQKPSL